ncbi:hypothetical protein AAJ76_5900010644 [Vairimorpha ceranae]|uniref:Uncharacterized protein n=1 Tax=Vairimorpha ceranae TaxID=40302 RepID=A0A0F9Z9S3_9MICR|nr:hypothetical protein AAJ76_5900010644 [Vairimorpha ceranae]KKO74569.1 hypothetical protein AAJ76_5900010644 [Vairimorpha ceranae]
MDFDTNIEIIDKSEISIYNLKSCIDDYLENNNINSIHKIFFDELIDYINEHIK